MSTRTRNKSKESDASHANAPADVPNEFMLSDEEVGGSTRSAASTGAGEAYPSQANASPTLQSGDSVNRAVPTDPFHPTPADASQANAGTQGGNLSAPTGTGPPQSAISNVRGQNASARETLSDTEKLRQLLSEDGIQRVDFDAFRRFLEYEKRQQNHQQPSTSTLAIEPASHLRQVSPQQAKQHGDSSSLNRVQTTDVVHVASSSSSPSVDSQRNGSTARDIIVLADSPDPQARQQASVSSDDIPLAQLPRTSRSSDEGTDGSRGSKNRVSWTDVQRGYSGQRCPMCGLVYSSSDEHDPFRCTHKNDNFSRTTEEWKWLDQFTALQRSWSRAAPHHQQHPQLPNVMGPPIPTPAATTRQPTSHSTSARSAVRREEAAARRAGVITLGDRLHERAANDQLDAEEDAALENASSSEGYTSSVTSSSYRPTTSESSLSSYNPSRQDIANMRRELQQQSESVRHQQEEIQRMMARMHHEQMQFQMHFQQQQMQMRMMPPFMFPMPPFPGPVQTQPDDGLSLAAGDWQSEQAPRYVPTWHGPSMSHVPHQNMEHSLPPHLQSPAQPSLAPSSAPLEGSFTRSGFVPAANHVQQAGMSGAPELTPEQLGKIPEFQTHVRNYNAYALKAVARGEPHLSLAQTMRKHAFAIATTFTTQLLKRYRVAPHSFRPGDSLHYTAESVMSLPDDVFTRLYTESCSISIEDPSQVHGILSQLEYVRQTQDEDGPLPALMRAEAAFRAKLSLLPQHAVERCRPQELRDAFIKMFFTIPKFDTMKMDFQTCGTWEQVYQQLVYRAGSSTTWYSEVPRHKSTPEISVTPTVSSSSPAPTGKSNKAVEESAAYWKKELLKLQKSVRHDPSILEDAQTDKRKVKILQKLKYKQALESEIREQVATAYRQQQQQQAREHSRDRHVQQQARDYSRERPHQQQPRDYSGERPHQQQSEYSRDRRNPSAEERQPPVRQETTRNFQRPSTPPPNDRSRSQQHTDRPAVTPPRSPQHATSQQAAPSSRPRSGSPHYRNGQ
jgi:hypothetical protein